jgi:hypothetical protein
MSGGNEEYKIGSNPEWDEYVKSLKKIPTHKPTCPTCTTLEARVKELEGIFSVVCSRCTLTDDCESLEDMELMYCKDCPVNKALEGNNER